MSQQHPCENTKLKFSRIAVAIFAAFAVSAAYATPTSASARNGTAAQLAQNAAPKKMPDKSASTNQGSAQPAAASSSGAPTKLAEVTVTGSRIASRSVTSSSPLAEVSPQQIVSAGQVSLDTALGQMPQFSAAQGQTEVGDVQGATGFQFGQSYSDLRGLGAQRTLVLLDGQRLVPTSPAGTVDLNVIPKALIKNVDVITGGASAVYGSDAVAGVVNFRLRKHFHGLQLSYQHGASTHGYGQEDSASILMGSDFASGKGNAVVDIEYNKRASVTGNQLPFFKSPAFARTVPFPPEGRFQLGGVPLSLVNGVLTQYSGTTPLSGSGTYPGYFGINTDGTLFTAGDAPNCVQNYRPTGHTLGLGLSQDCQNVEAYLGPYFAAQVPMHRYNLFARATYKINDDLQAYGEINFMNSTASDLQSAAFMNTSPKPLLVPVDNPFVQSNAALQTLIAGQTSPITGPLIVERWATQFGPRTQQSKYNDYQFTAGLKGGIGTTDLNWNVFGSYGQTNLDNAQHNAIKFAALENIMYGIANFHDGAGNTCTGYAWNPLGNHPLSKGCLEYVTSTANNHSVISQKYFEADLNGTLWKLPDGDLKFAVGADYRRDSLDYSASPINNPATNTLAALGPNLPQQVSSPSYDLVGSAAGAQTVSEQYIELRAPLLTNKPFAKDVELDVAARRSHYNLFGNVYTWKASLHWQLDDAVALRGGYNRAIRAPSLQNLYNPPVQAQQSINGDPCDFNSSFRTGANASQVSALCLAQGVPADSLSTYKYGEASANGLYGGNTALKPEKAGTYTLGIVFTPNFEGPMVRDIGASVDVYQIRVKSALGAVTAQTLLQSCFNANGGNPNFSESNFACQQITRAPNGTIATIKSFQENIGQLLTNGADINAHWGFPLGAGMMQLRTDISYMHNFEVKGLVPGLNGFNLAGSIANTNTSIAADGGSISDISHPKWKSNTAFGYQNGSLGASLHWRHIAAMRDLEGGVNSSNPGVPAFDYFDLDGHYYLPTGLDTDVELTAGITNLFDKQPPFVAGAPLLTDAATYDVLGRRYFANFKVTFH